MPVVAVGFAVALDVGAMSALAAGTLTTLAAVTAIGATVSAVGAVTHNKTLSYIGMGIGIVGAVGSMIDPQMLGNVSDIFGASKAAETASEAGGMAAMEPLQAGGTTNIATAAGDVNAAAVNPTAALDASTAAAKGSTAAIVAPGQGTALNSAITSSGDAATKIGTGLFNTTSSEIPTDYFSKFAHVFDAGPVATTFKTAADTGSSVSGLMGWANEHPMMAWGALQAGGSLISGLTDPMTPAQIDALNAQADVNRATADLIKRQAANQGKPLPVATAQVTGKVAPAGSIINNSQPVSSALITGTPNAGAPVPANVTGRV